LKICLIEKAKAAKVLEPGGFFNGKRKMQNEKLKKF